MLPASPHSLYIIGCGVLGQLVGRQWLCMYPESVVIGETVTDSSHGALAELGIEAALRSERREDTTSRFEYVLFCAPPSGFEDDEHYASEVRQGVAMSSQRFVLTSSGGVYVEDGGVTTEISAVRDDNARCRKILAAEEAAKEGAVLRLAGLYCLDRGPHEFWFRKGTVEARDSDSINLLHYEDAADAAIAALLNSEPGDLLLAADMNPRSRKQIVEAAKAHPRFQGRQVTFTQQPKNTRGPVNGGKVYDCSFTRAKLNWGTPLRYPTVEACFTP